jgi:N-acetyl-gamma-glutamyl-phosphate reductase
VQAYGLLTHRHTGEIEHALNRVSHAPVEVLFTPHLVPMTRGILSTCYARPARAGLSTDKLLGVCRDHYADEPFVVVADAPPATKATLGSNAFHMTVRYDDRTGTVLALGALDNLVKGASGQAIQAANLVLGLPETTGLPTVGMMP